MAQEQRILAEEFSVDKFNINSIVLFQAKRNSGKSTLLEYMLYRLKDRVRFVWVQCSTEPVNQTFQQFIPKSFIFEQDEIQLDQLNKLVELQKKRYAKREAETVIVIFDDMMHDSKTLNNEFIKKVVLNGRHFGIGSWICSQQYKFVPTWVRNNLDYVFCLAEDNATIVKSFWEQWFNCVPKEIWQQLFYELTAEYGAVVFNARCKDRDWRKRVNWIRGRVIEKETPENCPYKWVFTHKFMYQFAELYQLPENEFGGSRCFRNTGMISSSTPSLTSSSSTSLTSSTSLAPSVLGSFSSSGKRGGARSRSQANKISVQLVSAS